MKDHHIAVQSRRCPNVIFTDIKVDGVSKRDSMTNSMDLSTE